MGLSAPVSWSDGPRRAIGRNLRPSPAPAPAALIAPFAFLGPDYDPILREVYTRTSADNVFKRRPFTAVLFDDALADTAPLRTMIAEHLDADLLRRIAEEHDKGRLLMVATTNLDANQQVVWDIGAIASSGQPDAVELVRDIVLASAAIPGSFRRS